LQIKTTLRFNLTPVRIGIINNTINNKCWRGCREKGALIHFWWECKLVQPLWKTIWRLLKKLNTDLPYDPAIPLLEYQKTMTQVTHIQRDVTQVIPKAPAHPCLLQHYSQ
jgi:hypothetical protein